MSEFLMDNSVALMLLAAFFILAVNFYMNYRFKRQVPDHEEVELMRRYCYLVDRRNGKRRDIRLYGSWNSHTLED